MTNRRRAEKINDVLIHAYLKLALLIRFDGTESCTYTYSHLYVQNNTQKSVYIYIFAVVVSDVQSM